MTYLLDTNVVSEAIRPSPDPHVGAWVTAQSPIDLSISVITRGEIERGVAAMAAGARRARVERWAEVDVPRQFRGRMLPVDEAIALAWGRLMASARVIGRSLPPVDGLIVATAEVHGLTLVTRNVADCAGRGVPVLDPWTGTLHP